MAKFSTLGALICLMAFLGIVHCTQDFVVTGKVYCDTCAAGFVTRVSTYIPRARLAVQCKDHVGKQLSYTEGETDQSGTFRIPVKGDHAHDLCETVALSSPTSCNIPTDSNRGPVFLTHNNGINSDERITGPFAFKSTQTLAACTAVMQEYNMSD
eukprot:Gb_05268 [translate_table: standard]